MRTVEAGDYLLIEGISVKIRRCSDRFVYLETGGRLTREHAKQYKCSSEHMRSIVIKSRRVGKSFKSCQIGLPQNNTSN